MENRRDDIIHPAFAALKAFCNSQHLRLVCGATLPVFTGCIQFTSAYKTFYRVTMGTAYMLGTYKDEQVPVNPQELTVRREDMWRGHAHGEAGSALHEGAWGRGRGLRFSLCSYSQAVCLALEEAVPFSNMHKEAMCAPNSPGRRYRLRTH